MSAITIDSRDEFEKVFPIPKYVIRCGKGYACTEYNTWDGHDFIKKWEGWSAAMLQASPVCTCPSGDGSLLWPCPVHPGNSPAQSDCCPAQNHVSPEQNGDTPAKNQGWIPVSEQMPPSRHEVLVGRWWGEKPRWCCKWATYIPGHPDAQSSGWLIPGASWTPTHWMPLPAAPQEDINALIPLVSRNEQEVK